MLTTGWPRLGSTDSYAAGGSDVAVIESIFSEGISLAVLQRPGNRAIARYLMSLAFHGKRLENRRPVTLREPEVAAVLRGFPEGPGRGALVADYLWLLELFATVADAEHVGVRVVATREQICPRFHTDQTGLRLICTWQGPGTQWLEHAQVNRRLLGAGARGLPDEVSGLLGPGVAVQSVDAFDVAVMKGDAWPDNAGRGLVHRSPRPGPLPRVVLTLDAIF